MDELLPLPSHTGQPSTKPQLLVPMNVLRRTGSVAIIAIFLLTIAFIASTEPLHRVTGLRAIFGVGSDAGLGGAGWVAQDLGDAMSGAEGAKNGAIGESWSNLVMHAAYCWGELAGGLVAVRSTAYAAGAATDGQTSTGTSRCGQCLRQMSTLQTAGGLSSSVTYMARSTHYSESCVSQGHRPRGLTGKKPSDDDPIRHGKG
jgi:hypothetical protein